MKVFALNCPLCGGAVAPPLDDRTTRCGYCNKALRYTGDDFVPRLVIPTSLCDGALQEHFFKLLRDPVLPSDLRRRAVVIQKRKRFVPLYLLAGKRGGVLDTVKEKVLSEIGPQITELDESGGGFGAVRRAYRTNAPKVVAEPDARVVLGDFSYAYPAAAFGASALDETALIEVATAGLEMAEPADLKQMCAEGEVIEATIPVERIIAKGVESFGRQGEGIRLIELSTRIVYLPLFEIVFRYGEETFAITLDGVEGRVLSGLLPFRREWSLLAGLPLAGGLGFFLGKAAKFIFLAMTMPHAGPRDMAAAVVVFSAFAAILLGGALSVLVALLRTPFQVEVSRGGALKVTAPERSAAGSPDPLESLAGWVADHLLISGGRANER